MSLRKFSSAVALIFVVAAITSAAAYAAKPGAYSPTLGVSWPVAASSTTSSSVPYVIGGCGYDASLGGVTVVVYSSTGASFTGQTPDAGGCISISNFSTTGAGHYEVDAYQTVGKKWTQVASTTFDV